MRIEERLHDIGKKVLSNDRNIKSESFNDLIIVTSKESRHSINIKVFKILIDEVITELVKSNSKLTYTDTSKIFSFLIDLIPNATFFFDSRADKYFQNMNKQKDKFLRAGTLNIMASNK